ncbi:MAG: glycosyltransferase, partial [Sphingomicrobium sp.]
AGKAVIRFIHEGKAAYPDVKAFMSYFGAQYEVIECSPSEAAAAPNLADSVCWYMMGFYPKKFACAVTIHDYRSLSVGRFRRWKDRLKRLFNADPDIRIFQNEAIRSALGFSFDGRSYYLPMGVPELFIDSRDIHAQPAADFIYIGSMLDERRCELMLDSFVKRFGDTKRFDLYGPPNLELEARYRDRANIRFHGLIAQDELPVILKSARVGVCYFPMHYPHVLQTPTKLMEYGALGMRILANDHPQSRITAEQYGLHCAWGSADDIFAGIPDALDWPDNQAVDPSPMAWPAVIGGSGVEQAVAKALRRS